MATPPTIIKLATMGAASRLMTTAAALDTHCQWAVGDIFIVFLADEGAQSHSYMHTGASVVTSPTGIGLTFAQPAYHDDDGNYCGWGVWTATATVARSTDATINGIEGTDGGQGKQRNGWLFQLNNGGAGFTAIGAGANGTNKYLAFTAAADSAILWFFLDYSGTSNMTPDCQYGATTALGTQPTSHDTTHPGPGALPAEGYTNSAWNWGFAILDDQASTAQRYYGATVTGGTGPYSINVVEVKATAGAGPQSATLTGLASTLAFGTITTTQGEVSRTLTGLSIAPTVGSITLTPTNAIALTGLASTLSISTITITPGEVSRTLTGLASTFAIGTITTTQGPVSVTLTGLASTLAIGAITTGTAISRTLTGLASTLAVGTITLTPGPISIAPTGLASTLAFGTLTVSLAAAPQSISLTGLASTLVFGIFSETQIIRKKIRSFGALYDFYAEMDRKQDNMQAYGMDLARTVNMLHVSNCAYVAAASNGVTIGSLLGGTLNVQNTSWLSDLPTTGRITVCTSGGPAVLSFTAKPSGSAISISASKPNDAIFGTANDAWTIATDDKIMLNWDDPYMWTKVDDVLSRMKSIGAQLILETSLRDYFMNLCVDPYSPGNFSKWQTFIQWLGARTSPNGGTYGNDPTIWAINFCGEMSPFGEEWRNYRAGTTGIQSVAWSSGTVTVTFDRHHNFAVNDMVYMNSCQPTAYNLIAKITAVTEFSISYAQASNPGTFVSCDPIKRWRKSSELVTFCDTIGGYFQANFLQRVSPGGFIHTRNIAGTIAGSSNGVNISGFSGLVTDVINLTSNPGFIDPMGQLAYTSDGGPYQDDCTVWVWTSNGRAQIKYKQQSGTQLKYCSVVSGSGTLVGGGNIVSSGENKDWVDWRSIAAAPNIDLFALHTYSLGDANNYQPHGEWATELGKFWYQEEHGRSFKEGVTDWWSNTYSTNAAMRAATLEHLYNDAAQYGAIAFGIWTIYTDVRLSQPGLKVRGKWFNQAGGGWPYYKGEIVTTGVNPTTLSQTSETPASAFTGSQTLAVASTTGWTSDTTVRSFFVAAENGMAEMSYAQARTKNDAVTDGSATVTSATMNFTATDVGKPVTGLNIPANTYVGVINSSTSIGLSSSSSSNIPVNASGSGTGAITITQGDATHLGHVTYKGGDGSAIRTGAHVNTTGSIPWFALIDIPSGVKDTSPGDAIPMRTYWGHLKGGSSDSFDYNPFQAEESFVIRQWGAGVGALGIAIKFGQISITTETSIAPTGLASTLAFGTITTTQGAVSRTLTGLASTLAFGTITMGMASGPQSITATGLASTLAIGTITTSATASVNLTGLASTLAFGTITTSTTISRTITGLASTLAIGTITTTQGPVSVTLTGLASTLAFGTVAVNLGSGPQSFNLTGLASTIVFGSITITPGAVSRALTGLASTLTIGTITTSAVAFVNPTGLALSISFGTITLVGGGVAIALTGLASSIAFGSITITPGAVSRALTGLASTLVIGTITTTRVYPIYPTGLALAVTFGTISFTTGPVSVQLTGLVSTLTIGQLTVIYFDPAAKIFAHLHMQILKIYNASVLNTTKVQLVDKIQETSIV